MGHEVQTFFETTQWAQCRNEPPFQAWISMRAMGADDRTPCIDCPTCARRYRMTAGGTFVSDRALVFLDEDEELRARSNVR